MGVKVTLQRYDGHGKIVTHTFDDADQWAFIENEGFQRLVLYDANPTKKQRLAEFAAGAVESVEFV